MSAGKGSRNRLTGDSIKKFDESPYWKNRYKGVAIIGRLDPPSMEGLQELNKKAEELTEFCIECQITGVRCSACRV
jgi:hypothetical protein